MSRKPEYTEAIHAKRLMAILEKDDVCECCPAARRYISINPCNDMWAYEPSPCMICAEFIGQERCCCPCFILGREKAIELTVKALQEKGYM